MGRNRNKARRQVLRQIRLVHITVKDLAIVKAPEEVDSKAQPQIEVPYEYPLIPGLVTVPKYETRHFLQLGLTILDFERALLSINKSRGIYSVKMTRTHFFAMSCPVIQYFWHGSSEPSNLRLPQEETDKTLFKPIPRTQFQRNERTLLMENLEGIKITIPFIGYLPLVNVHLQDIMKRARIYGDQAGINKAMICQLWKGIIINIYFFESDSLQAQKLTEKMEDLDRVRKLLQHAEIRSILRGASVELVETSVSVAASKNCKTTRPGRRPHRRVDAHHNKTKPEELVTADINNNSEKQARARLLRLRGRKRLRAADFLDCPDNCPSCGLSCNRPLHTVNNQMPSSSAQAAGVEASFGGLGKVQSASIDNAFTPQLLSPTPIDATNALSEQRPPSVLAKTSLTKNQKPHANNSRKRKRKRRPQDLANKKLKSHQDASSVKTKVRGSKEPEYDTSPFIVPNL